MEIGRRTVRIYKASVRALEIKHSVFLTDVFTRNGKVNHKICVSVLLAALSLSLFLFSLCEFILVRVQNYNGKERERFLCQLATLNDLHSLAIFWMCLCLVRRKSLPPYDSPHNFHIQISLIFPGISSEQYPLRPFPKFPTIGT